MRFATDLFLLHLFDGWIAALYLFFDKLEEREGPPKD